MTKIGVLTLTAIMFASSAALAAGVSTEARRATLVQQLRALPIAERQQVFSEAFAARPLESSPQPAAQNGSTTVSVALNAPCLDNREMTAPVVVTPATPGPQGDTSAQSCIIFLSPVHDPHKVVNYGRTIVIRGGMIK